MAARKRPASRQSAQLEDWEPPKWLPRDVHEAALAALSFANAQEWDTDRRERWTDAVRRLCFSERARQYWTSSAWRPRGAVALRYMLKAICEDVPSLLVRPKERKVKAERIAKLAEELRSLVQGTGFDTKALLPNAYSRVQLIVPADPLDPSRPDPAAMPPNPHLSDLLERAAENARARASSCSRAKRFNDTRDQQANALSVALHGFHVVFGRLGSRAADTATAGAVSALLDREWEALRVIGATRGRRRRLE